MRTKERGWQGLVLQLGALAGAVAAILGLVFLLFPGLKPTLPEVPKKRAVALGDLRVEHRGYRASDGYHVVIVHFRAQVDGYPGAELPVLWRLFNADTGQPYDLGGLGGVRNTSHMGSPTSAFKPTAESDLLQGEVEVAVPFTGPSWKVWVEVAGPGRAPLDSAETPPFKVASRAAGM
jgi:hypothetical protein